jgi:hypothetical protein
VNYLKWDPTVKLGDVLTGIGFLVTALSVLFAGLTLRRTIKVQRGDFLLKLTERYFQDAEVRALYLKIDWNQWTFDRRKLGNDPEEHLLDRLLYLFDEIGQLLRLGVLDKRQAAVFAFQASRVFRNKDIQEYLRLLDSDYGKEGLGIAHCDARYLVRELTGRDI